MKNLRNILCIITLCLICIVPVKAQLHKGSLLTGSTLSFGYDFKPVKSVSYAISPDLGIFVTDKIATIGEIFFSGYNSKESDYKSFSFGGYYSVRYYLAIEKFCPFAFFKVGGYYTRTKLGSNDPSSYDTNHFMPGMGIDYFLNEHIAVEGMLGYGWGKNNQSNLEHKYSYLDLKVGLQFFFALPPRK